MIKKILFELDDGQVVDISTEHIISVSVLDSGRYLGREINVTFFISDFEILSRDLISKMRQELPDGNTIDAETIE